MYRIQFDTSTSRWIISLQRFGFLWIPIKVTENVQSWPDYDAAAAYVKEVGLDRVYRSWHDSTTAAIWQGVQLPQNQPLWQGDYADPAVIRRRAA